MFGKRLINTGGVACTTDTLQILGDTSCVATYRLNGDATDLSGNYNGTATSVTYVAGKFGDAGSFNGSSSFIDTNYTIPASSTYSFSVWFKSNTAVRQALFGDIGATGFGNTSRIILFIQNSGKFQIIMGNGSSDWSNTTVDSTPYADNNWHNIVLVINGTSVKLYADGNTTPIGDLTSSVSAGTVGTQSISLGKRGDENANFLNGSLDQVRIFNKALTTAEVTTLYNEVAC